MLRGKKEAAPRTHRTGIAGKDPDKLLEGELLSEQSRRIAGKLLGQRGQQAANSWTNAFWSLMSAARVSPPNLLVSLPGEPAPLDAMT